MFSLNPSVLKDFSMKIAGKSALRDNQLEFKEKLGFRWFEVYTYREDVIPFDPKKWDILESYKLEPVQIHCPHVSMTREALENSLKAADYIGVPLLIHEKQMKCLESRDIDKSKIIIENDDNRANSLERILEVSSEYNFCLDLNHLYKNVPEEKKNLSVILEDLVSLVLTVADENDRKYPINSVSNILHVCNNHFHYDLDHLPLVVGLIDYNQVFQTLKKYEFGMKGDEIIVIETPVDDPISLRYVEKQFEDLLYSV